MQTCESNLKVSAFEHSEYWSDNPVANVAMRRHQFAQMDKNANDALTIRCCAFLAHRQGFDRSRKLSPKGVDLERIIG